jgi:hypothetical protein
MSAPQHCSPMSVYSRHLTPEQDLAARRLGLFMAADLLQQMRKDEALDALRGASCLWSTVHGMPCAGERPGIEAMKAGALLLRQLSESYEEGTRALDITRKQIRYTEDLEIAEDEVARGLAMRDGRERALSRLELVVA